MFNLMAGDRITLLYLHPGGLLLKIFFFRSSVYMVQTVAFVRSQDIPLSDRRLIEGNVVKEVKICSPDIVVEMSNGSIMSFNFTVDLEEEAEVDTTVYQLVG